jgi:Rieske Fe-S protein
MDPYHYVRIAEDTHRRRHSKKVVAASDILIIGGADHKTGQSGEFERPYEDLEEWARQRFPSITDIPYRWSGQVMETIDGLGFIGLNPDDQNVYVATGDSGMGMTHGTIGGMLVSDLIQGRSNPWTELYEPSRLPPAAVNEFAKENLNVLVQYTDWIDKGDVESLDDIERGSGAVYVEGFDKWAAYRDHDGNLQQCSAVCPHLGCIVNWNSLEHTWDCPCHGSRFAPDGKVLNGPASEDLAASREWKESSVRNLFLLFWNGGGLVINTGLALAMTILAPFRWLDSRAKGERHSKHEGSAAPRPSVPRRSSPKW